MCTDMPQSIQLKQNGFADPEPSRLKAEFPLALRVSPNIRSKDFFYTDKRVQRNGPSEDGPDAEPVYNLKGD